MADRTKTYQNYLDRVQRLIGIDSLTDDDKEFLLEFYNKNARYAYEAYPWPETCTIDSRAPSSNRIALDGASPNIGQVLNVWNNDPLGSSDVREVPYVLVNGGIQFFAGDVPSAPYIWFQERWTDTTGTVSDTLPYAIFEYVCKASAGDWLCSNDQYADGRAMQADAEELLIREIEHYERTQAQPFLRSVIKTHGSEQVR